jgi:hypothetical protein
MQRLLSSYALYARYKHRRPGHLFQGRFKAKLVEDEVYLLGVTRYIHRNPVKIATCRRMSCRERCDRLETYPWSSYRGYVAAGKAEEFIRYDVLQEYGRELPAAERPRAGPGPGLALLDRAVGGDRHRGCRTVRRGSGGVFGTRPSRRAGQGGGGE